jgi:hypothetical protein
LEGVDSWARGEAVVLTVHVRTNAMKGRKIELVSLVPPENAGTHLGILDDGFQRISVVEPVAERFLLRLQDSAGIVTWEPSAKEMPLAGGVFARVLQQLYDGRRWRLCVELDELWLRRKLRELPRATPGSARRGVTSGGLTPAFCWRGSDAHGVEWQRDYWWCLKESVSTVFERVWSPHGPSGFAMRRSVGHGTESSLDAENPRVTLTRLLTKCSFLFECARHGSEMLVLSHTLTNTAVESAVAHASVRAALRRLSRSASFAEWKAVSRKEGRTVYRKDLSGEWWWEKPDEA